MSDEEPEDCGYLFAQWQADIDAVPLPQLVDVDTAARILAGEEHVTDSERGSRGAHRLDERSEVFRVLGRAQQASTPSVKPRR